MSQFQSSWPLPPAYWTQVENLEPPPIPKPRVGIPMRVFGEPLYQTKESVLGIEEQYINEVDLDEPIEPNSQLLKQLNRGLLLKFLELVKVLINDPKRSQGFVREIRLIFVKMHIIFNAYRPYEARETIIKILEKQVKRREEVLERLKEAQKIADGFLLEAKIKVNKKVEKIKDEQIIDHNQALERVKELTSNEYMPKSEPDNFLPERRLDEKIVKGYFLNE